MKTAMKRLMLLVLFLAACGIPPSVQPLSAEQPSTEPPSFQQHTQMNLPKGPVARLGKGKLAEIQYSPDGTQLAVASRIGIWLYDTTTYREVALLTGHEDKVYSMAFSPDGKTVASGGGRWAQLWDVATSEPKAYFDGHTSLINSVAFSPDGKTLATGDWDSVSLWKVD